MWNLSLPWWEFVVRGVIVYVFLLLILRVTGKRQTGQLAPFDLVLLLVLSNAVQNSMNGGDNTVLGGLISATTLIALHYCVAFMTFKNKTLEAWIEGTPRTLIHNGVLDENVMRSQLLTHHELAAALRAAGCAEINHVRIATLENNGQITVTLRRDSA
jgi:uncharacterized membrane protein YcaP (DUF421 family)